MTLTVYTFEDELGSEQGWTTQDYEEAKRYAAEYGLLVVANEYEFAALEPLEDFRPGRPGGDDENDREDD